MTLPSFPLTVREPNRADAALSAALDGLTRSAAQKWLEEGRVTLDGRPPGDDDAQKKGRPGHQQPKQPAPAQEKRQGHQKDGGKPQQRPPQSRPLVQSHGSQGGSGPFAASHSAMYLSRMYSTCLLVERLFMIASCLTLCSSSSGIRTEKGV